jgi:hypothetical protein
MKELLFNCHFKGFFVFFLILASSSLSLSDKNCNNSVKKVRNIMDVIFEYGEIYSLNLNDYFQGELLKFSLFFGEN